MPDAPRMSAVEGRSRLERLKRFQLLERLSGLAMLIAIPVFALSYFQIRAIDAAARGGGVRAIPWLAWIAVGVFVASFATMRLAKRMIGVDHAALIVEDRARAVESPGAEHEAGRGGVDAP